MPTRALAHVQRETEHQLAALKIRLDPPEMRGDRTARTAAMVLHRWVEQPLRELQRAPFRDPAAPSPAHEQIDPTAFGLCPARLFNPAGTARQIACHRESIREAQCQLSTPSATVKSRSGDLGCSASGKETGF